MNGYIIIPRWDEFQHRDMARSSVPPWIKFYTRLLHDENYLALTGHQRAVLHGLWLEYASTRRQLPLSTTSLTARLRLRIMRRDLEALNDAGWIVISASKPASKVAGLEVEVDVEREKSTSKSDTKAGLLLETTRESLLLNQLLKPVNGDRRYDPVLDLLAVLPDADAGTETILRNFRLPEYAYRQAIEEVAPPRNGSVKLAVTILKRVKGEIESQQQTTQPDDADIPF